MANQNTENKQNLTDNICNELLQKGIKPTVTLVLAKIPNINSRSTVHKYFKKWADEQNRKKEDIFKKLGFSSEFTSSVLNEVSRFNCEAEQRYIEQAQYANDQRNHAISDLQNSENKVNEQASLISQFEEMINNLQTELATEQKSNESTVAEIRKQLTTSLSENKKLTTQNESLRTAIAKSELRRESNQELVDEIKSQNAQLTIDNKELHLDVAELNRGIASKESTITGNEKLILILEAEQEKTATQLNNLDSMNTKLQSEMTSSRNELSNINAKLSDEKDRFTKQVSINNELKSNFEEQTRTHKQTLRSYESTITGNEKLIAQLEKTPNNQS